MYIYNVTSLIDPAILQDWLSWMRDKHLPAVMDTGCFQRFQLVRLLDLDASHGLTFAVQYYAQDRDACDHFANDYEPVLERESQRLWGEKCLSFKTLMEVMH
ncbi:MAG TPA: DUF4286 family protein [Dinghuibacter sp.]|uniref:DUF4286 family protein n=1 Tax=Dinghuibacter sp. TaxID=2024697 RepID=UPI002C9E302A|nr:DUF4286 family protein [Dinghuibacter sp.]HTJ12219.1 DUF4286 family protein [Dinghuibacter sp.]